MKTVIAALGDADLRLTRRRMDEAAKRRADLHVFLGTEREAAFMRDRAEVLGIRNFVADGGSTHTVHNAMRLGVILRREFPGQEVTVGLVTSKIFHMPRSLFTFRELLPQVRFVPLPVDDRGIPTFHRIVFEAFPVLLIPRLAMIIPAKRGELVEGHDTALNKAIGPIKATGYLEKTPTVEDVLDVLNGIPHAKIKERYVTLEGPEGGIVMIPASQLRRFTEGVTKSK